MYKKLSLRGEWIWRNNNQVPDDFVVFRKKFMAGEVSGPILAYVAAETKYWLYLNGYLVVFEGGLFRESLPGAGYADTVDLTPYIKGGENNLEILCWYYGNGGRNNTFFPYAGFLFSCEALGLYSGSDFLCAIHPSYYRPGAPEPAYLYGGYNVGFNANLEFNKNSFVPATAFPRDLYGNIFERPIPLLHIWEYVSCGNVQFSGGVFCAKLPYAAQFVPVIKMKAKGGEVINIRSDRYKVNGGPGDEKNQYNGHRLEYICKPGVNAFESINYLFGEEIIISADNPVEILEIGYRQTGFACEIVGRFECDDARLNKLVTKAARTLFVCMRDNFMDCPDRERGQWIGDVSAQVMQVMYVLDQRARLLVKKCILDFINLREGNVLLGLVPGENKLEIPAQSLNAISEWGLIAQYYKYTGDISVLEYIYEPAIEYLKLWNIGDDGLVIPRNGGMRWFDHLYNVDEPILENAWYYSGLRFLRNVSDIIKNEANNVFLDERIETIKVNFCERFFNGEYYTSGGFADDRANAMAVLSGLASKSDHAGIRKVLISVFNASIYMENYILIALCEMGYINDAYRRMMSRYYNLIENENSTLWEDFYILGTKNHAWSGAPLTIAFRYFLGIDTINGGESYTFSPCKELFGYIRGSFAAKSSVIDVSYDKTTGIRASTSSVLSEVRNCPIFAGKYTMLL